MHLQCNYWRWPVYNCSLTHMKLSIRAWCANCWRTVIFFYFINIFKNHFAANRKTNISATITQLGKCVLICGNSVYVWSCSSRVICSWSLIDKQILVSLFRKQGFPTRCVWICPQLGSSTPSSLLVFSPKVKNWSEFEVFHFSDLVGHRTCSTTNHNFWIFINFGHFLFRSAVKTFGVPIGHLTGRQCSLLGRAGQASQGRQLFAEQRSGQFAAAGRLTRWGNFILFCSVFSSFFNIYNSISCYLIPINFFLATLTCISNTQDPTLFCQIMCIASSWQPQLAPSIWLTFFTALPVSPSEWI